MCIINELRTIRHFDPPSPHDILCSKSKAYFQKNQTYTSASDFFFAKNKKRCVQGISLKSTSGTLNQKDWTSFYSFSKKNSRYFEGIQFKKYFWHFK